MPKDKKLEEQEEISLQDVLTRLDSLERENKMLKDIAGKNKVADWMDDQRDKTTKFAHLKIFNGKPVVGWRATVDRSYKMAGQWMVEQKCELEFMDGSKQEVEQIDFARCANLMKCKIVSISHSSGEAKIQLPSGEERLISVDYLNA